MVLILNKQRQYKKAKRVCSANGPTAIGHSHEKHINLDTVLIPS